MPRRKKSDSRCSSTVSGGIRGFQLRDDANVEVSSPSVDPAVENLVDAFAQLDAGLVRDVVHQVGLEDAVSVLSSLMGGSTPDSRNEDGSRDGSRYLRGYQLESEAALGSQTGGDAPREVCSSDEIKSMWDDLLPMDCKRIIWGMLPSKDMHRASATSKEWYAEDLLTAGIHNAYLTFLCV
jgi:hypothetical protein